MDQIKIGRFIAECRKKVNLTQSQLAEKLNITNRAVSKWETGKALPDSSIMLALCAALGITVNDLLSGEVVTMENYNKKSEEILLEMTKQKQRSDRQLLVLEWVIGILACVIIFLPVFLGAFLPLEDTLRVIVACSGLIPGTVGLVCAMRIEQVAGYYQCQHCDHRYVPGFRTMSIAMHIGRTRYMRCPKCNKKSWQKKVLTKE